MGTLRQQTANSSLYNTLYYTISNSMVSLRICSLLLCLCSVMCFDIMFPLRIAFDISVYPRSARDRVRTAVLSLIRSSRFGEYGSESTLPLSFVKTLMHEVS